MSHTHAANEAAIREQAYLFWEEDGRPHGRDNEYWMRAVVALSDAPPKSAFPSAPPPKTKVKAKPSDEPKAKAAAAPKAAAASKSKAAPAKSAKAGEKKPKKK